MLLQRIARFFGISSSASAFACATAFAGTLAIVGCATNSSDPWGDDPGFDKAASEKGVNPDLANEELADGSAAAAPTNAAAVEITDLRYKGADAGGTVVIETSAPATFRTREIPRLNQVVVEVANAKLPERFKRPYAAKEFRQDIASINAYQDEGSSTARFVIQFRSQSSASVRQEGRLLVISPATPGSGGNVLDPWADSNLPGSYTVEGKGGSGSPSASGSVDDMFGNGSRFYGKPVSLEARDTPVREIISAIAELSGANIVLSDEVKDKRISIKLRQVPWDQALMLIMKAQKLGYVRQGTVLRIASLDSLRSEAEEAKKVLEAQRKAQPMRTKIVPVSYAKVDDVKKAVEPFMKATNSTGQLATDIRTSSVLITDIPENIDRIVNVIKALDTPPLQVMIEGKVLEANEKFQRSFGINWGADGVPVTAGNFTISPTGPQFQNMNTNNLMTNSFGLSVGTIDVLGNLNAMIGLGESQELVRILSAPRILAMNNEKAIIKQSVGVPQPQQIIPATGGTTVPTVGYTYQQIKLELNVTPQITAESDIILDVDVTREFVANGEPSPTSNIESRFAKTKVLVRNGQTAVIGGIYQNDVATGDTGMPFLKDIPVLGYLFKSSSKRKTKNELLLFLTPRILNAERALQKEEVL